jgi:hypothetical protein
MRCSSPINARTSERFLAPIAISRKGLPHEIRPAPFADLETAARKLMELAKAFEPIQGARIYIEKINGPFLLELKGTPAEYKAGPQLGNSQRLARAARERHLCPLHR